MLNKRWQLGNLHRLPSAEVFSIFVIEPFRGELPRCRRPAVRSFRTVGAGYILPLYHRVSKPRQVFGIDRYIFGLFVFWGKWRLIKKPHFYVIKTLFGSKWPRFQENNNFFYFFRAIDKGLADNSGSKKYIFSSLRNILPNKIKREILLNGLK